METLIKVVGDRAYVSLNSKDESCNTSTDDLSCGSAQLLTDSDKCQIQHTVLKLASQWPDNNFVEIAKNLCEAVKAIKGYQ